MNTCTHYWQLEGRGPRVKGVCRICGATKIFENTFKPDLTPFGNRAALLSALVAMNRAEKAGVLDDVVPLAWAARSFIPNREV